MVWELKLLSWEMEDGRIQLEKRIRDIRALRDGVSETILFNSTNHSSLMLFQLFSATRVIKSRQSRILNENVRLLNYVSIFFFPLAFCVVSIDASRFGIY
jgi:hypothetical protein